MRHGDGFSTRARGEVARALQYAGEASGLKYAVVVRADAGGRPGPTVAAGIGSGADELSGADHRDTEAWARAVHAGMADPRRSVLVAVDPAARAMRIVTGERSRRRLPDDTLDEIVALMAQLFATRGLVPGLVTGLQELGQRAGPPRQARAAAG